MLAVAGGKGGCGKTTTTLALARAIARTDAGAIAVDADVDMPDLHDVAGTPAEPGLGAVAEGTPVPDALHRSMTYPGVDVLAAPANSRAIAAVADRLRARPERVLIDTPAGASRDVSRPLSAADRSVLVTTPTEASVRDAAKTVALARTLGAPPVGTIVTRSDGSVDPSPLLSCPTLSHVPAVSAPSRNDAVRDSYATCLPAVTKRNV